MERSQIPLKEYSGILNMTQGLNIDKLKKIMVESYPDKVLKDLDGRTSTTKPTWSPKSTKKPFKKRPHPVKTADGPEEDEDGEENEGDDPHAHAEASDEGHADPYADADTHAGLFGRASTPFHLESQGGKYIYGTAEVPSTFETTMRTAYLPPPPGKYTYTSFR